MKLSILIPVYNVAPYLKECLASVATATQRLDCEAEVICIDDGSLDDSGRILDHFKGFAHAEYKVLHQKNRGVSIARNRALDIVTGDWIAFVDADDTVDPDWFVRMMTHAGDSVDLIHADSRLCFEGHGASTGDRTFRTFLRDGWGVLNFIRRSAIGSLRFKEGMRFKEDVIFFTELALRLDNERIAWVREEGYRYRRREGSAVNRPRADNDSLRFISELAVLDLPREDFGRTVGYDLVQWVMDRDRNTDRNPKECRILQFWREGLAAGRLKYSDLRWWWYLGLDHWIKTGMLDWFDWTIKWRVFFELGLRKLLR